MLSKFQASDDENTRKKSAKTAETKSVDASPGLNLFKIIKSAEAFKAAHQHFINAKKVESAICNKQSLAMIALLGHHLGVIPAQEIADFSQSDNKDILLFEYQNKVSQGISDLMNKNIKKISDSKESKLDNYYVGFKTPDKFEKDTYLFIGAAASFYQIDGQSLPKEALVLLYRSFNYLNRKLYCISTVIDLIGYSAFGHDEISEMEALINRFGCNSEAICEAVIKEEIYPFFEQYEDEYHEGFIEDLEYKIDTFDPFMAELINSETISSIKEISREFNKILQNHGHLRSHDFYKIMKKLIYVAKKTQNMKIDRTDFECDEMPLEFGSTIMFDLKNDNQYCDDFYNYAMEMSEEPTLKIKLSCKDTAFNNVKNVIEFVGYILGFINYMVSLETGVIRE